jgi:glucose-6-phosphate isomerase
MTDAGFTAVTTRGGRHDQATAQALARLAKEKFASRLWARDGKLFGGSPERAVVVENRLGWLDSPGWLSDRQGELALFAREIPRERFTHVVLLGMGGSSLCPEVLSMVFGLPPHLRYFAIVDATDPATILRIESEIDLTKTLFIVASKSGGTTETRSQGVYFFERLRQAGVDAGRNFVAITDPGSSLERWAEEARFRRVFLNPGDIGGRYSALSYFGMVPGALLGLPLAEMVNRLQAMAARLHSDDADNPGLCLGALIGAAARAKCDKLTFLTGPLAATVVPWIEQLVAESTGKEGTGIVPIEAEPSGPADAYGDDRVMCTMRIGGEALPAGAEKWLATSQRPRCDIHFPDRADLGALFLLWEFAVSAAGWVLGINPFDEPNVQESKDNTNRLLANYDRDRRFDEPPADAATTQFELSMPGAAGRDAEGLIARLGAGIRPGDFLAFLYFADRTPAAEAALAELRRAARDACGVATLRGFGPRYLHSIGQLYKGGPQRGHYVIFTVDAPHDAPIPGAQHGFAALLRAQALGDFEALAKRGRPVMRVHLKGDPAEAMAAFVHAWKTAAAAAR